MIETYAIDIAGVKIKIVFPPTKDVFFHDLFIRQWKPMLAPYIIPNDDKIERAIYFIEESFPEFKMNKNVISVSMARKKGKTIFAPYHISLRYFYCILAQIVLEEITKKGGFYLHCSAINTEKGVVLFLGSSGSGKSTIARLLGDIYPVLADDQIIINKDKSGYFLYQMFIPEKNKTIVRSINKYRIYKFFFLKKSESISQIKISNKTEILRKIVSQLTASKDIAHKTTVNLIRFVKQTNNYNVLKFSPNKLQLNHFFQQTVGNSSAKE